VVLRFALVFLLAMVLNPIVVSLQKHHIPRLISVILLTTSEDSREQRATVVVQTRTIERRYREAEMFPFNSSRRRSKHGDQKKRFTPTTEVDCALSLTAERSQGVALSRYISEFCGSQFSVAL
jgi:hypothetical protein